MISRLIKYAIPVFLAGLLFTGCEKEEDIGGTAVEKLAGAWWVQISVENELIADDYFPVMTYNTADNVNNKMWIDDQEEIWPFKFKCDVNMTAQTFTATNAASQYSNITTTLQNGKVLTGVSKGPVSRAVTDSIYFEIEFSDDPGVVYQFHGYRRTRFEEDDH